MTNLEGITEEIEDKKTRLARDKSLSEKELEDIIYITTRNQLNDAINRKAYSEVAEILGINKSMKNQIDEYTSQGLPVKEMSRKTGFDKNKIYRYIIVTKEYKHWRRMNGKLQKLSRLIRIYYKKNGIKTRGPENNLALKYHRNQLLKSHKYNIRYSDLIFMFKKYLEGKTPEEIAEKIPSMNVPQITTVLRKSGLKVNNLPYRGIIDRGINFMCLDDIAYFTGKDVKFIKKNIVKHYIKRRLINDDSGYRIISLIFESQDNKLSPMKTLQTLRERFSNNDDLNIRLVSTILNERKKGLEDDLITTLRKLFPNKRIDKPYLSKN